MYGTLLHYCYLCRLHLKQPSIPVLFLTEATTPAYALAIDIRNKTVYDAVAFAKSQDFIVSHMCSLDLHMVAELVEVFLVLSTVHFIYCLFPMGKPSRL